MKITIFKSAYHLNAKPRNSPVMEKEDSNTSSVLDEIF